MENPAFSTCQFLYYIFPSYPKVHVCRGLANLKTVLKKNKSNRNLALQWEQPRISGPVYVDSLIYYHYYFLFVSISYFISLDAYGKEYQLILKYKELSMS